jgi:hypothetical protein
MSDGDRVHVRDLLIAAGYPDDWVRANAAHVSRTYYHHRRPGPKAPKDGAGIAIYEQSDAAGLLDAARDLKEGNGGRPDRSSGPACDNEKCTMWRQEHGGPCDT